MSDNSRFWQEYNEVNELLKKQAFIQMPGGQQGKQAQQDPAGMMPPPGMDPAAAGMDPSMMGADPAAMGGMPMDPAAAGMDPSMMGGMPTPGMDPAAMGGMPGMPMDPSMMGMPGAPADPGAEAPTPTAPGSPMITISLDQLFEIIQKVLGLAKKVGVNGAGVQQPAAEQNGITADQLKSTIYEALGSMAG